jgi:hypothetical protein
MNFTETINIAYNFTLTPQLYKGTTHNAMKAYGVLNM